MLDHRMTQQDVLEVIDALEQAGVPVWVDGGWGVDALVGEETRPHADLDLALDRALLETARSALESLGFRHDPVADPGRPARLVMRDERGRQVDLHPLVFDVAGDGWQQLSGRGRAWGRYPAAHLQAVGTISGRSVRCLSAELQGRFRLAHEWTERDEHHLRVLVARFADVPVPPPLWDASLRRERVGPGRRPRHEMEAEEVVALIEALEQSAIQTWLDGGWGVDALLRRQTRQHDDLDLVVDLADVPKLKDVLAQRGYTLAGGGPPMSFELVDTHGRQVDVHPVVFDERGNGVYLMRTGEEWSYPATGFAGAGSVLGRDVRCLTAEVQVLCHEGYELSADDLRDLQALREAFGVRAP
jgi:lincosamide nucleotidyltransferase A/C/D/E